MTAGETTQIDGGGAMEPRDQHGSTLSAHRAFVVHFGASGGPGRRRFSGRVEHLSSGESMRFTSLKGLLAFFASALDAGAPRGRSDRPRIDPPADRPLHVSSIRSERDPHPGTGS